MKQKKRVGKKAPTRFFFNGNRLKMKQPVKVNYSSIRKIVLDIVYFNIRGKNT